MGDKLVYKLNSKYSKDSKENSSSNSNQEYLFKLNEDLFNDDEKLILLDSEVTPNLVINSSMSYENTTINPNE